MIDSSWAFLSPEFFEVCSGNCAPISLQSQQKVLYSVFIE